MVEFYRYYLVKREYITAEARRTQRVVFVFSFAGERPRQVGIQAPAKEKLSAFGRLNRGK